MRFKDALHIEEEYGKETLDIFLRQHVEQL